MFRKSNEAGLLEYRISPTDQEEAAHRHYSLRPWKGYLPDLGVIHCPGKSG
jgi:hypothetical protein